MAQSVHHVVLIQSLIRRYLVRRITYNRECLQMMKRILHELQMTETSYVNQLEIIVTGFVKPLIKSSESADGVVTQWEIESIFSNSAEILELHRQFLRELTQLQSDFPTSIPRIIQLIVQTFDDKAAQMYAHYLNNFDRSCTTLDRLNRSPTFVEFLEDAFSRIKDGPSFLHLPSYLMVPVQRIPRYVMLLEQMVKYTEDHNFLRPILCDGHAHMRQISQTMDDLMTKQSTPRAGRTNHQEKAGLPTYMRPTIATLMKVKAKTPTMIQLKTNTLLRDKKSTHYRKSSMDITNLESFKRSSSSLDIKSMTK
eukprot:TRINITY_DN12567_c0_g1_i1.p1 TRINITY_DN12567_c0_g1~~TRINITY_DN12567_c0_g1_i1.p1  ORF type:complete len:310 (-),score=45.72 TRINITY_DN12567_c0_g1_i1:208-1137(-)